MFCNIDSSRYSEINELNKSIIVQHLLQPK